MVPAELLTTQTLLQTNRYLGSTRNQLHRDSLSPNVQVLVDYILEQDLHDMPYGGSRLDYPKAYNWYYRLMAQTRPGSGSMLLGILALLENHLP